MRILVGIDGGPQQEAALALAAQLAHGGELVVATAYPVSRTTAGLGKAYKKAAEDAAAKALAAAGEELAPASFEARSIADIHPARALHDAATEMNADLIVIGACHRGSIGRALLGGTGESVVHGSPCPVVVAPRDYAGDAAHPHRIGVAYDASPESEGALAWAEKLAASSGAALELMTVTQFVPIAMYPGVASYPTDSLMSEMREDAERQMQMAIDRIADGVAADGRVMDGPVIKSLVDASEDLDLLVAGSRAYGPVGSVLMGSVSHTLMHEARCPVVVVPRTGGDDDRSASSVGALMATE